MITLSYGVKCPLVSFDSAEDKAEVNNLLVNANCFHIICHVSSCHVVIVSCTGE
jgi:hypothetical protein